MIEIMMLGFATADMIRHSMQYTNSVLNKTLFDVGYPADDQTEKLKEACREYHWNYQKMENHGTAGNWNEAWRFLGRPKILVGVEPDEYPNNKSWIPRAVDCLLADPTLGYVGMGQSHFKDLYDVNENFFNEKFKVGSTTLKNYKCGIGWAMGAVSGKFMEKVGMKSDKFYGNLESKTHDAMTKSGFRWGLFDDIHSVHMCGHPLYEEWKVDCADGKTTLPFAEWFSSKVVPELRGK